jgi:hypothetical protein
VDALIQRASQQLHAAAAAAVIEQRDAAIAAVRFLGDAKSPHHHGVCAAAPAPAPQPP